MTIQEDQKDLSKKTNDYMAKAINTILGAVPVAGPLLVELSTEIIPNQRVDRIVNFTKILDERLSRLEEEFVKSQLNDEYFTDLLEEGVRQASRAISKERKEYISSLIANSLSSDEINYIETKHLMKILGELNDIEIIILKSYSLTNSKNEQSFREKHENILNPSKSENSDQEKVELNKSYKEHLAQLGLLENIFHQNPPDPTIDREFDHSIQEIRKSGFKITEVGRLMLRKIGI